MALLTANEVLAFYKLELNTKFKNPVIPSIYQTESGLTSFKITEIQHFSEEMTASVAKMNSGASSSDIDVNGGGGAPGSWTGGIGTGGLILFSFSINLNSVFGYEIHKKWIKRIKERIDKAVIDYVSSYTWTSLPFGESGVSTHTSSSPGTLSTCKNTKSKLGAVGVISPGNDYNNFELNLKEDLEGEGFFLTEWLEEDIRVLALSMRKVMKDWFDNTEVSNVDASGGVTAPAAGTLADGIASGGTFS